MTSAESEPPSRPCRLCGLSRQLRKSHFLPAHVYRQYEKLLAPGTHLMMAQQGKAFVVGKQITQYLLCDVCEGRLSDGGESYFAQVNRFNPEDRLPPLLYRLLFKSFFSNGLNWQGERLSLAPGFFRTVDSKRLFYFAISMFWRGGLEGWPGYKPVAYSNGLMEAMRNVLLGQGSLSGYVVRVVPSFFAEKWGAVLPLETRGKYFFNVFLFDFYLEEVRPKPENKNRRSRMRNFEARTETPLLYQLDLGEAAASHQLMLTAINGVARARKLPPIGDLVSWERGLPSATGE